ncbi:MAG: formylglycine-generating enzyme family protein [Steroidobacteraceae bacterium]|jgi:formylglycine-generating enzyme required for sulfatase activity|nr:formylglycine-generating enzyme family protein [Steroidobacteraceae bacterium]
MTRTGWIVAVLGITSVLPGCTSTSNGSVAGGQSSTASTVATASRAASAPGSRFRDCPDCPEMVVVPPGEFAMGFDGGEPQRYEGPVRRVRIGYAFAVGRTEVTNAQYRRFVERSGHRTTDAGCEVPTPDRRALVALPGTSWADPGYGRPIRDDEPVACVRWSDAKAYVSWLSGVTGRRYRLLTEAEWEYAARAGTAGQHTWADEKDACRTANVFDRASARGGVSTTYAPADCDDGFATVAPVGSLAPNAFGLHDMIGNVWEWIEDCYEMPYSATPADGSAQLTRGCERRGSRGGGWRSVISRQTPTFRGRDPEALTSQIFGFRIARDL